MLVIDLPRFMRFFVFFRVFACCLLCCYGLCVDLWLFGCVFDMAGFLGV